VKELEFLADNSVISRQQLSTLLEQLPSETAIHVAATPAPTAALSNLSLNNSNNLSSNNEKRNDLYASPSPVPQQQQQPPPAYHAPATQPNILAYATSLYPYNGTDAGDLSLQPNDRIAVTEYMNGEWWKGRNERTGQEGIFPRSYVRAEEKGMAPPVPMGTPQPSSYGNMPMQVSQDDPNQQQPGKGKSTAQKLGGKLGNAAIFGAGGESSERSRGYILTRDCSYDWQQHCQLYFLSLIKFYCIRRSGWIISHIKDMRVSCLLYSMDVDGIKPSNNRL
jgi:LAS seventeen-binding protein 1/2